MAYGKAPEEVPHVRGQERLEESRSLQGQIQRWESACRQRPGRHARPRGGRRRPQAGDVGLPGVRLRAHVLPVIDNIGSGCSRYSGTRGQTVAWGPIRRFDPAHPTCGNDNRGLQRNANRWSVADRGTR